MIITNAWNWNCYNGCGFCDDDAAAADDDAGVCRTPLTVGVFSEALIITTGDIFCRFCRSCF